MQVVPSEAVVHIRACADVVAWRRCVELQREVWQFEPAELVPVHVLAVVSKTGGQVLGAFDEREEQIGFALAFPAFRSERRYLHSHMLAVLPEWQNRSVGRRLKIAQREEALGRGVDLVEWTFDPLEVRNAHFNIARLGAIIRHYLPDVYGPSSSPLHRGLPTDRLVAEWWLKSRHVEAVLQRERSAGPGGQVEIAVPADAGKIPPADLADIQQRIRSEFNRWFARGYTVTDFALDGEHGKYLLEPYEN